MSVEELKPPCISEWLSGRSVFITGASGLVGKIVVEKILRECKDVNKIYVLIREKKGKTIPERIETLKNSTAFRVLRSQNPEALEKIFPIEGDVSFPELGLRIADRDLLHREISVVFHVAASVKFDDPLTKAVFINTRGTRDVIELAKGMSKLQILVYVSTGYTNCDKKTIQEKVYPAKMSWQKMIKAAETIPEDKLNVMTAKLLGTSPNTYIFTKNLAERVVWDHRHVLPVIIYRPTVVVNSVREPEPGWIDSLNSPTAMIGAVGKGVLRIHAGPLDVNIEYIPVDITANGMIAAAWYHACVVPKSEELQKKKESLMVYNATTMPVPTQDLKDFCLDINDKQPMSNILWRVYFISVPYEKLFLFFHILVHFLPSLIYDLLLKAAGKKIRLGRIYRMIYITSQTLRMFLFNEWTFIKNNYEGLTENLLEVDKPRYRMDGVTPNYTKFDYLKSATTGGRQVFQEPLVPTEKTWRHVRRMYWLDMAGRFLLCGLVLWVMPFQTMWEYTQSTSDYIINTYNELFDV